MNTGTRLVATLAAALMTLTLAGPPAAAHRGGRTVTTAVEAVPTPAAPEVDRSIERTVTLAGRAVKARAAATATTRCDGCRGRAVAFQVVRVPHAGRVGVDNTAEATASCVGCSAAGVSVQVVIARTRLIAADNRAAAVNVSCERCASAAAAYQFVLVGSRYRDLSRQGRALIRQIEAEMAALLAAVDAAATIPAAPGEPGRMSALSAAPALTEEDLRAELQAGGERIGQVLRSELGATPQMRLDVQTG